MSQLFDLKTECETIFVEKRDIAMEFSSIY